MSAKPKAVDFRDEVAGFAGEAVQTLVSLMRNSSSDQVRMAAARELIDRAHGKPRSEPPGDGGPTLQEMIGEAFARGDR